MCWSGTSTLKVWDKHTKSLSTTCGLNRINWQGLAQWQRPESTHYFCVDSVTFRLWHACNALKNVFKKWKWLSLTRTLAWWFPLCPPLRLQGWIQSPLRRFDMQLWRAVQILAAPVPFTPHRTYLYWASRTFLEQAAGMYPSSAQKTQKSLFIRWPLSSPSPS